MFSRMLMAVGWPAFLSACALEATVFAVVDPLELSWGGMPLGWTRQAVYTGAFFVFWVISIGASALSVALVTPVSMPGEPAA